jgi:transketolase
VAIGAGLAYGTAGYSHHLIEDISALSSLPNLQIYSPADALETKLTLKLSNEFSGPKYIRLGKGGEGELTSQFNQSNIGYSILEGSQNRVIVSTGNILSEVLKLREQMPGVKPTIVSLYALHQAKDFLLSTHYPQIVTVEEHILRGGFGSLVRETLQDSDSHIKSFGILKIDSSLSGSQDFLRDSYGISSEAMLKDLI